MVYWTALCHAAQHPSALRLARVPRAVKPSPQLRQIVQSLCRFILTHPGALIVIISGDHTRAIGSVPLAIAKVAQFYLE